MQTIQLKDPNSGALAEISPEAGFNCYRFSVPSSHGPVELLWTGPDFFSKTGKPSHHGNPILFPFPGRIAGESFTFQGQSYALTAGDGRGNAIHGFVLDRPWHVVEHAQQRAVGQFCLSKDAADRASRWPSDFLLTASVEVKGTSLYLHYQAKNIGASPLPCGLGIHPYFRLPLATAGSADECTVRVPALGYWELVDLLPTGRILPAEGPKELATGRTFAKAQLDDVYTQLQFGADGWARATISDPTLGRTLEIRFDQAFTQCVVYTPPHRGAICIEPYTCVPDAFRLAARGIPTGQRTLAPGESFEARVVLELQG